MQLNKDEKLFLLECMKMAAEEGFYLSGHYGSKLSMKEKVNVGTRLCLACEVPLEGRDWLKDYEDGSL